MADSAAPNSTATLAKSSGRGSKPGERRGGRAKGVPNKATADIKALAGQYAPDVIKELARLALEAESEAARVAAGKEVLDRVYGKSTASVDMRHSGSVDVLTKEQRDAAYRMRAQVYAPRLKH